MLQAPSGSGRTRAMRGLPLLPYAWLSFFRLPTHMKHLSERPLAALAAFAAFAAFALVLPAQADSLVTATSSAGSSASSAGSASLRGSSNSISGLAGGDDAQDKTTLIPAGGYRVADVTAVQGRADTLRLSLAPQSEGAPAFHLDVPAHAFGGHTPAAGDVIQVQRRAWGLQFARDAQADPFFLVLAEATLRELDARPL